LCVGLAVGKVAAAVVGDVCRAEVGGQGAAYSRFKA
jgi:hypothetical protein